VSEDEAVVHIGTEVRRYTGLDPATSYRLDGIDVRTLPRPTGELLSVVATVNDLHFGEVECGRIEGTDIGPILSSEPGDPPYPETMSGAAITEIAALRTGRGPDAVVAKGDLTASGTPEEYAMFLRLYREAFGSRLYEVRGNHDAHAHDFAAAATQEVVLPGAVLAILDTAIPEAPNGRLTAEQLGWLDELGARADRPVLVFGHHQPWNPSSAVRPADYFGINPDDSEALVAVFGRRAALAGYFAGHTHRNRVREFDALPGIPIAEVASVKDFPGCWAEYRIFEGGILQIHRRISAPAALAWTNRTRAMLSGTYADYSFGRLADRCFAVRLASGASADPLPNL